MILGNSGLVRFGLVASEFLYLFFSHLTRRVTFQSLVFAIPLFSISDHTFESLLLRVCFFFPFFFLLLRLVIKGIYMRFAVSCSQYYISPASLIITPYQSAYLRSIYLHEDENFILNIFIRSM